MYIPNLLSHMNIKSFFSPLDVKIYRENNKFTTSVYSFIPTTDKFGSVYALLHSALRLLPLIKNFIIKYPKTNF